MPQPVDLAYALGLEPREAVAYFRSKGYAITFNWEAMAAEAHARAFTVAKVTQLDVLQSIRGELDRALAEGLTFRDFQRNLEPRLKALGWWGQRVVERPDGTAQVVNVTSPHRLQTIYRTNLQSAYMAGRYRDFLANVKARPFWQYVAVMDNRTRPSHAALNGKIFRHDDPIWRTCWPPNGYNCRCRVRALSQKDLERKGLAVSESGEDLSSFEDEDPSTGEIFERIAYKGPGMERAFSPDRGFAGNQGASASWPEIAVARKAQDLGPSAAAALLAEVNREHLVAWKNWILELQSAETFGGATRVAGYARAPELAFMRSQGGAFASGAIEIEDRLIVGKKAARYERTGVALSRDDWLELPLRLAARQAVLYHAEQDSLIYILRTAGEDVRLRLVVRPGFRSRGAISQDLVRSAARVQLTDLRGLLRGGRYRLIDGEL